MLPDSATTLAVLPRAPGEVYGAGQDYQRESDSSRAFLRRFDGNNGSTVWDAEE